MYVESNKKIYVVKSVERGGTSSQQAAPGKERPTHRQQSRGLREGMTQRQLQSEQDLFAPSQRYSDVDATMQYDPSQPPPLVDSSDTEDFSEIDDKEDNQEGSETDEFEEVSEKRDTQSLPNQIRRQLKGQVRMC